MIEEVTDRKIREKRLMAAIDKPHLLIYEESFQLHSSAQDAEAAYGLPGILAGGKSLEHAHGILLRVAPESELGNHDRVADQETAD